jgi:hypothetical protein
VAEGTKEQIKSASAYGAEPPKIKSVPGQHDTSLVEGRVMDQFCADHGELFLITLSWYLTPLTAYAEKLGIAVPEIPE